MWNIKQFSKMVLVILFIGVLAACGETTDKKSIEANQNVDESSQKNETVTYQAANGEIEYAKNPEKIVVVADSYVGHFIALGVKPVGISDYAMGNKYFEGELDGIESIGDASNPSVEKILEMNPDLIITFNGAELNEKLEKIAPTIAVNYGEKDYKEQLKEFGKIIGKEKEADAWLTNWNRKINESKAKVQEVVGDKTISILSPFSKGIYAYGHNYARGGEIIYGEFELKAPELVQKDAIDSGKGWTEFSLETLPEFAGDYIFTCPWQENNGDPEDFYGSSLWKELPAVKEGKVFELDTNAAFFNDPVSLDKQLDFIIESLTTK
ncbi:ABC transporter substrate-binding protein [Bacillus sp. Bva_UNVM-123]|uniref:ABC transporter substrate-binding protein n=1 Tax=Bacillus sp. Bva_UNVM-123 TaxID=2829798 RepID=UPI00391EF12D